MEIERTIVISDVHIPYHDPHAIDLLMRVVAVYQPERIVLNGDLLDFYAVSQYDKDPDRLKDGGLQQEIDIFTEFLGRLRDAATSDCEMHYLPGNHEDRLRRYLWKNSGLYGLRALELPALLGLESYGVHYHEDELKLAGDNLVIKHGRVVRKWAAMSAKAELENEKYSISTITGHTHRMGAVYVRTRRGIVGAWEGGCLCNLNPEYVHNPDWQQGIVLVRSSTTGQSFNVDLVPFLGGDTGRKALIDGKVVRL